MFGIENARALKFAAALMAVMAMAACSKNQDPNAGAGGLGGAGGAGAGGKGTPGSVEEFAQSVGDRIFFESDSSELTPTAQATLDKQAQWLNQYGRYRVVIEGHADERGTREYNFALSARRSEVTKTYLTGRGVSAGRVRTTNFGKERPVAVCNDISCWSQNRRAVTVPGAGAGS
jgi:peptidoglycan-associated lipoprotein